MQLGELLNVGLTGEVLSRPGLARELREKIGHASERDVAAALACSHAAVSRWERGVTRPRGDRAAAYGRILRAWLEAAGEG